MTDQSHITRDDRERTGALVIGGDYRGLGVVRSLGRQGIPVCVLTDEHLVAATSRYARYRLPWPTVGEDEGLEYLCELSKRFGGWVVFPTGDETAALISRNHHLLSNQYRLTTPPWDTMRWAYDKRLTEQIAARVGVDFPWTCQPANRDQVAALDCIFPVLLKPAYKHSVNEFTQAKAWQIEDQESLLSSYDAACRLTSPDVVMVQQLIPGGGESQFAYAALCQDGRPLASITARRTRQHPLDFGQASSFVESIEEPEVELLACRLINALHYTGLIEVEFKYDRRDGRYKLLDLNPRVWGWHTLARRAGVDFPYLQWQLACGLPVPHLRAVPGERWVRMLTDIQASAGAIRRGQLSLSSYLRSLRPPVETAIWAVDDALPALLDAPLLLRLAIKRRLASRRLPPTPDAAPTRLEEWEQQPTGQRPLQ